MFKKSFLLIALLFSLKNNTMFQKTITYLTKKQLPSKEVINKIITTHLGRFTDNKNILNELAHQELTESEIDTKLQIWYLGPAESYFPKLSKIAKEIYDKSK